jgi:lysyl-tRNA synthetase class 2
MLEWYRAGESYESLMMDCVAILALAARREGIACSAFAVRLRSVRRAGTLTVAEAFTRFADIDLLGIGRADGSTDRGHLAAAALACA